MIIDLIDRTARRYADAYGQFLLALTGVVANAISDRNAFAPLAMTKLTLTSYEVAGSLLNAHRVSDDGEQVMLEAIVTGGGLDDADTEVIRGHCGGVWASAQEALTKSALGDQGAAKDAFRRFLFDAMLKTNRMGERGALVAASLIHLPVKASFVKKDRSSKTWTSAVYVRTVIRSAMLSTYADAYLFALSANGFKLARVVYETPDHKNNGIVFSIDGSSPDVPSYEDIRPTILHPNATAQFEPVLE